MERENQKKKRKNPLAVVCSLLSVVLLLALVLICLPLTVPRLFGYQIYTVVSGSMEPAIPTGSLVYIKGADPQEAEPGEVIAFYGTRDSSSIITHRVVENHTDMAELITKGDANPEEDLNPVPYNHFVGVVTRWIPGLGNLAQIVTSASGKGAAAGVIAAAVLLQLAASALGRRGRS